MRRSLIMLAAAAGAVALLSPGQTANGRTVDLIVKKFQVRPGTVAGSGADVTVTAQFGKPMPRITQVTAIGYVPGTGYGPNYPLTEKGGGSFEGTCRIPVNRALGAVTGSVTLQVVIAGASQPQRRTATVKVLPWVDSGPPPPPTR